MSEPLEYRYVTSFHWALCQFSGTMEVNPQNMSERFFAVSSLFFAFFVSACVVSSITSSMTHLEIATAHVAARMSSLKQYLFDNNISRKLALRVQRNAQHVIQQRQKNRSEDSVELLTMISPSLQRELHFEIYMPRLDYHPFLHEYCELYPGVMKQVCHTAVSQLSLMRGDLLFSEGEIPPIPHMYMCFSGRLFYHRLSDQTGLADSLLVGEWACESVLWTPWVHCGTMRAKADCTLIVLDAEAFQTTVARSESQGVPVYLYGRAFVDWLNTVDEDQLTDLWDNTMSMADLLKEALPQRTSTFETAHAVDLIKNPLGLLRRSHAKRLSMT